MSTTPKGDTHASEINVSEMKSVGLPKIRATRQQIDALLKSVGKDIDAAADKEEPHGLGRIRAKNLVSDSVLRHVDLAEKSEITMTGAPDKLLRVEVFGEQGAGKSLLLNLIDTVDRSVRSENLVFHRAVSALAAYIHDFGLGRMVEAADETVIVQVKPGYDGLFSILKEALDQAQKGKGAQRHSMGGTLAFENQRMQTISDLINSKDGMVYQIIKKLTEGVNLPTREAVDRELLGVIVYTAGLLIWMRNQDADYGMTAA